MYECVMGMKKVEGQGVIMADEMCARPPQAHEVSSLTRSLRRGLGKTLQTIALCWTLLKQSPYVGPGRTSVSVLDQTVLCSVIKS